jgi:hypothetical protein
LVELGEFDRLFPTSLSSDVSGCPGRYLRAQSRSIVDRCRILYPNAVGVCGASTDQKITAALRQLSLGVGADAVIE